MAEIANTLTEDLKTAMRAKDSIALSTLRAVKSAIKNAAIEKGGADAELDEGEIVSLIRKQIKQRQDSHEQFSKAGRSELAEQESAEIAIVEGFLPKQLDEGEIESAVTAAIAEVGADSLKQMGKVMASLRQNYAGQMDFGKAGAIAKQRLA